MDIKIYDRDKKSFFKEKVSGESFLDFLYDNRVGILLREGLIKRKVFQNIAGAYFDSKLSKSYIKKFIKDQNINMDESVKSIQDFKNFNDFFIRELKNISRPIDNDSDSFISPGDGRLLAFKNINKDKLLQVKGIEYSMAELIGNDEIADTYEGGLMLVLRLNPSDYHRFHFVDNGVASKNNKIDGHYYSVNPIALKNIPNLYLQNKREWSILSSENFGQILMMEVGATSVGSIIQSYEENSKVFKGEEKGYFKFGGSTTILFIEKNRLNLDLDILEQSASFIECKVKLGEKIGTKIIK